MPTLPNPNPSPPTPQAPKSMEENKETTIIYFRGLILAIINQKKKQTNKNKEKGTVHNVATHTMCIL